MSGVSINEGAKETEKVDMNKQLTTALNENINTLKSILSGDSTIIFRDIENLYDNCFKACLIHIDGMINVKVINESIIYPIVNADLKMQESSWDLFCILEKKILYANKINKNGNIDNLLMNLFNGDSILLVDGYSEGLIINTIGWQMRNLSEPEMEKVLRGPREGFNESIMINLSLIRRKLKTPDLKFKFREIGVRSRTRVCICYIETLASDEILKELESRLDKICIDAVLDSGYIQQLIQDSPLSSFKTIGNTERPDVVAAKLLEGRIAVVVDGTPAVLTLPFVFLENFQEADDYYLSYTFASINRFLRGLGMFFSTSIPAVFVALITFHQEILPSPLLLSISSSRQGVPFPTIVEVLILLFAFEVIREASMRLPSPMSQSVSIVGAIIIGQSAVEAKIFSSPMVIIVAITGITGLLTLRLKGATIIIRLILLLLAGSMGLYGYIFGVTGFFIYMFSMRSFGVPYMLEYGSINPIDLKDTFIRAPWWYMTSRPKQIAFKNIIRQRGSKPKGK